MKGDGAWTCNECGSAEYSGSVSEDDLQEMSCGGCGACDFHWEEQSFSKGEQMTPEEKEIMERGSANLAKMNLEQSEPQRKPRSDKGTTRAVQRKVTLTFDLASPDERSALNAITAWLMSAGDTGRVTEIVAQLSKLAVRD